MEANENVGLSSVFWNEELSSTLKEKRVPRDGSAIEAGPNENDEVSLGKAAEVEGVSS